MCSRASTSTVRPSSRAVAEESGAVLAEARRGALDHPLRQRAELARRAVVEDHVVAGLALPLEARDDRARVELLHLDVDDVVELARVGKEIRQLIVSSSIKKLKRMQQCVCADGLTDLFPCLSEKRLGFSTSPMNRTGVDPYLEPLRKIL